MTLQQKRREHLCSRLEMIYRIEMVGKMAAYGAETAKPFLLHRLIFQTGFSIAQQIEQG